MSEDKSDLQALSHLADEARADMKVIRMQLEEARPLQALNTVIEAEERWDEEKEKLEESIEDNE